MTRRCCDCGLHKPESEFAPRKSRTKRGAGLSSYCRPCLRLRWRKWAKSA